MDPHTAVKLTWITIICLGLGVVCIAIANMFQTATARRVIRRLERLERMLGGPKN